MWTDRQLRVLINERKNENDNFHELSGNMKHNFWKGLASKINLEFGTTYTGRQCKEKFNSLKMQLYIEVNVFGKNDKQFMILLTKSTQQAIQQLRHLHHYIHQYAHPYHLSVHTDHHHLRLSVTHHLHLTVYEAHLHIMKSLKLNNFASPFTFTSLHMKL
ncbi:hypothetical protein GLOIN_2v1874283 [Rhizophagus irregularis DAOM 181602=DAOM 197198]|nr:hypothetical protein GLOIN_2v1874283 [Rhizophagus irregularis DAOM 181602=DAOM 197198]